MRVHHLNCISTCPLGGKLMDGRAESIVQRGELACHCLLVETGAGLVLVDAGLGLRDAAQPKERLSAFFLDLLSPAFREEMTAVRQVQRLGFDPRDVRHIVLTHLDFDHAGGLDDFPHATVHTMAIERDYALTRNTWLDRQRFRPQQWSTRARWRVYSSGTGERWFGFERVRALDGVPPEGTALRACSTSVACASSTARTPARSASSAATTSPSSSAFRGIPPGSRRTSSPRGAGSGWRTARERATPASSPAGATGGWWRGARVPRRAPR